MKTSFEARAILAAAHDHMDADIIANHALALAGVVASQNALIAALCENIRQISGMPMPFVDVESAWPNVYNAGVAANG